MKKIIQTASITIALLSCFMSGGVIAAGALEIRNLDGKIKSGMSDKEVCQVLWNNGGSGEAPAPGSGVQYTCAPPEVNNLPGVDIQPHWHSGKVGPLLRCHYTAYCDTNQKTQHVSKQNAQNRGELAVVGTVIADIGVYKQTECEVTVAYSSSGILLPAGSTGITITKNREGDLICTSPSVEQYDNAIAAGMKDLSDWMLRGGPWGGKP